MTTFTAIALDPGGTTGWAYYRATKMVTPDDELEWYNEEWKCGQIGPDEHHSRLDIHLGINHTTEYHVIYESFEYRNAGRHRDNLNLAPREYIGVTKRFCQERGVPCYAQTASVGKITKKSFVRKENLVKLDLWYSGYKHAMDATGHLLTWMINGKGRTVIGEAKRLELLNRGWR